MTRPLLLVTGFGPFPRVPRNPSGELARAVAASPGFARRGWRAQALVLPVTYPAIGTVLCPALERLRPDAVLMLGVAARRRAVCVEVAALNRVSRLFPDASGRVGTRLAIDPAAPLRRPARAPTGALLAALTGAGVPARLSRDAGRYLCNAAYFAALDPGGPPVVFVHVPLPRGARPGDRRPTMPGMAAALTRAALRLTAGARPR